MSKLSTVLYLSAMIVAIIGIAIVAMPSQEKPVPTSELPAGYMVSSVYSAEDAVWIYTHFENRNIPVKEGVIEVDYLNNDVIITTDDGHWELDIDNETDVWWWSRIGVNESVTLPTNPIRKEVALVEFDSKGNPVFSVSTVE